MALSSGKIGKNSYLTSKEILPPDQSRLTEQAEFFYSTLGNVFQKQIKAISDQGKKTRWSFRRFKISETSTKTKVKWISFSNRFRKQWSSKWFKQNERIGRTN